MNASPMTPNVTGRAVDQKILWSYLVSLTSVVFMPKKLVTNDLEGIVSFWGYRLKDTCMAYNGRKNNVTMVKTRIALP